jgi:hypothetical protein
MASRALKIDPRRNVATRQEETLEPERVSEIEIAARAYEIWQSRGCPIGSAEEDWFQAERELTTQKTTSSSATGTALSGRAAG